MLPLACQALAKRQCAWLTFKPFGLNKQQKILSMSLYSYSEPLVQMSFAYCTSTLGGTQLHSGSGVSHVFKGDLIDKRVCQIMDLKYSKEDSFSHTNVNIHLV